MELHSKELFEQIEIILQEQKIIEKKLDSIAKKLNVNEQQLKESSNFLLSTSNQLFTNKIELLKEKKFTDDLLLTANVIIVIYNKAGDIKRFNSFAENVTGYKEEEVLGLNWFDQFMPTEDKEVMKKNISELLMNNSESNSIENKILCKDGTLKRIDWACTLINSSIDKEGLILNIGIDITKRKNIEDTLAKERKLFSAGPVAILAWEPKSDMPVKYVSSNIEKILGYTKEEMTSPNFEYTSLLHINDIERVRNEVLYNKENNIDAFEQSYRLKHKNGQYRWFYDFTNFIRDRHNNLIEVRGYMFDQTILKQTENEIKSQKQRLDHIVKSTKLGTWEWNINTNEFIVNEQWANIIGYTLEELSPITTNIWVKYAHTEDIKKSSELLEKHINGDLDYYSYQCRMKHKDGYWVYIHDKGKVYTWTKDGKAEWMFGTHQDISERKEWEGELKIALEKAEESDRLKSAFISNISHEIRTPLNGILGVVDLISSNLLTAEELEEFKSYMEISSARLMNTISDMVEIAHIESKQVTISLSKLNLNTLIDEIYESHKDLMEKKKLNFSMAKGLHDNEAIIICDRDKLKIVLSNFVSNAFKFTSSGSINVGYKLLKDWQDNRIEFFVKDTGAGIHKAKQEEIYKYFIQADAGYSKKYEGIGLGLSINRAYIEMMNGQVFLESKEGKGSRFSFSIPYNKTI